MAISRFLLASVPGAEFRSLFLVSFPFAGAVTPEESKEPLAEELPELELLDLLSLGSREDACEGPASATAEGSRTGFGGACRILEMPGTC